jgi:arylsulfatase A-like enzyme
MERRNFIGTCAGAAAGMVMGGLARSAQKRPNIVIIMADDMGFSDLGCYSSEIDTPNIDGLAARGMRFTHFYNAARCCPTRASLLTGLYPHQAGMGHMAEGISRDPAYQGYLKEECITIAEALGGRAGYHTLMAGKWHVGAGEGHWPVDRGFEEYFGILGGACNYFRPGRLAKLARNDELVEPGEGFYTTDAFTDHAIDFIREYSQKDGKPYFLYLAYNAPHWPLHAKPEDIEKYRGRYLRGWDFFRQERYERQLEMGLIDEGWPISRRDRATPAWKMLTRGRQEKMAHKMAVYAAMVDCLDQNVGRLLEVIEQTGGLENTLIMFLSDNGACHEWGPFGVDKIPGRGADTGASGPIGSADSYASYGRGWSNLGNTPFRLHKHWTHEGGISTPLITHWPRVIKHKGLIVNQPGHVIDLMATCLDAAGVSYPSTYKSNTIIPLEGKSLVPIFKGRMREGHEAIYWEHEGNRAVRMGKWKLVSDHPFGWRLYDMESDRTELNNLARQNPGIVREMSKKYHTWAKSCGVKWWPYGIVAL